MKIPKILVACEESGRVTEAFRKNGCEAYSCDILPTSGNHPEWHFKADVLALLNGCFAAQTQAGNTVVINGLWDAIIAFPPCTYLTTAGTRWFSRRCNSDEYVNNRMALRYDAIKFFMRFVTAKSSHIAIENPVGCMSKMYRKPDQYIHPYYFSAGSQDVENFHTKKTCLWLKGLPELQGAYIGDKPTYGKYSSGKNKTWEDSYSRKASVRSKTFPAIAEAMGKQWGDYLKQEGVQ